MADEPFYEVHYGPLFSTYFGNYPRDQQTAILKFVAIYQQHGLDFDKYEGKLAATWNVPGTDPKYYEKVEFARRNELWHYHIGLPAYTESPGGYKTSDMVLHLQRHDKFSITLLDCYFHYTEDGSFYFPQDPRYFNSLK